MTYDWSTFSQKIKINAPAKVVYDMWTTRKGLQTWFLRMAEFTRSDIGIIGDEIHIAKGDTYRWRWHGYPDEVTEIGEVLEANGKDRLSFVFGNAGIVTVTVQEIDNNNCELMITQHDIPTDEVSKQNFHVGCSTGWTFYRCNLKSVVEGGIDLRNKGNNDDMND